MKKCAACAAAVARDTRERRRPTTATMEAREVCRRVRRKSPQWWEKTPGWVWKDAKAELARQSRRLARQPEFYVADAA